MYRYSFQRLKVAVTNCRKVISVQKECHFTALQRQRFCSSPSLSLLSSVQRHSFNPFYLPRRFYSEQKNVGNQTKNGQKNRTDSPATPTNTTKEDLAKMTLYERFKFMFKNYWKVIIPVHFGTYAIWFGSFYYLSASGVDIAGILENIGFTEKIVELIRNHPSGGHFAIAFALCKLIMPVRYLTTLGLSHYVAKLLIRMGVKLPQLPSVKEMSKKATDLKQSATDKGIRIRANFKRKRSEFSKRRNKNISKNKNGH